MRALAGSVDSNNNMGKACQTDPVTLHNLRKRRNQTCRTELEMYGY